MLERLDRKAAPRESMKQAYTLHLERLHDWLKLQANIAVLCVSYNDLVERPQSEAERVCQFLDGKTSVERMVQTVDPSLYRNRKAPRRTVLMTRKQSVHGREDREAAPVEVLEYAPPLPGLAGWFLRHVPAVDALRRYSWRAFGGDLVAGLTVATVAVPQAMAYATLAGVPPQYGLYTAIVMTAVGGAARLVPATHQRAD